MVKPLLTMPETLAAFPVQEEGAAPCPLGLWSPVVVLCTGAVVACFIDCSCTVGPWSLDMAEACPPQAGCGFWVLTRLLLPRTECHWVRAADD